MSQNSTRLAIYVQPRASRTETAGMHGDAIKIRLTAPPVDNAANAALIEFLATQLALPKSGLRIVSGASARRKIVECQGISLAAAMAKLRPAR